MLENECRLVIPDQLRDIMEKTFLEFYDQYVETVKNNLHLDGTTMIVCVIFFNVSYNNYLFVFFLNIGSIYEG